MDSWRDQVEREVVLYGLFKDLKGGGDPVGGNYRRIILRGVLWHQMGTWLPIVEEA